MRIVISKDGTPIAFDQSGQGPALILVAGALTTRAAWIPWRHALSRILACSPTTGVAEGRVGTQHRMRSSARSKISMP